MQTPFLVTDHFNLHQATPSFHPLPIPQISSPSNNLSSSSCFDIFADDNELLRSICPLLSVSLQLDGLPIDDALSKFFSDALPQTIDADFPIDRCRSDAEVSAMDSDCSQVQASEEGKKIIFVDKDENGIQLVHFEAPEPRFMVDKEKSEKEKMQNLLEEYKCEDTWMVGAYLESECQGLEKLHSFKPGMIDQDLIALCLNEIQESVYAVEDISLECSLHQKLDWLDEADPSTSKIHRYEVTFPLLEVDEFVMGNDANINLEDEILCLLETIKVQNSGENNDTEINCRELLGCPEIDVLACSPEHCLSKSTTLELHLASLNVLVEINLLHLMEASYTEENMEFFPMTLGFHCVHLAEHPCPFEDLMMLDVDIFYFSEAFSYFQRADEVETCDRCFQKEMKFKSFEDLIVSHELAVADDFFKALPVPVLVDDERAWSLHSVAANILSMLDELPASASDEIYLDWHLLGKDKCNCDITTTYQKVFNDTEPYSINPSIQSNGDSLDLLDSVSSGDSLSWLETKEDRLSMMSGGSCGLTELGGTGPSNLSNNEHLTVETVVISSDTDSTIVPSSGNHGSQFNDLEFFLNPRKTTSGMGSDLGVMDLTVSNAKVPLASQLHMGEFPGTSGLALDAHVHDVNLSANLLILLNSFQKMYMAIFEDYLLITKSGSSATVSEGTKLLSFTEKKLLECMGTARHDYSINPGDNNFMAIGALCAIKRMAWCLSFYGIHALHGFIDKLFQDLEFLKSRLNYLQSLVVDAYRMVDKEITKLHPTLALIEEILRSNSVKKRKVLIVADLALWWPLKKLLESMNMSIIEVKNSAVHENLLDTCRAGASVQSDCCLASREYVSASLVSNKFDVVLEYGGPYGSSIVSTILPKCSLQLHFLKVELDGVAKALCEGVGDALNGKFTMASFSFKHDHPHGLEELLDFSFIVEKFNSVSVQAAGSRSYDYRTLPVHCTPRGSKLRGPSDSSFPETIIIVNTQNFQKEMIISRRSTYQSILAMEKDGAQVVERDLVLPVDIIISASMCLAWYDCGNIGKKATMPDEASSSIPLCVDNIAANVLTSLSFAFSSCILVFEGESSFLDTIMESSDVLYAAVASLGIDLQIFFSYSSELAEEIILSCIRSGTKSTKGLLPKLPESETLAESFLTKFPSINPLIAHAILSTVGLLVELFEWSRECRKHALQKYLVAEEIVSLLSVLCRYGELEESKSGTTDCSSSVSSAPTSRNLECKFTLERQKQKTAQSPHNANDQHPSHKCLDSLVHYPAMPKPTDFISPQLSDKRKLADISLADELFGQKLGANTLANACPSAVSDRNVGSSRFSGRRQKSGIKPSVKLDLHDTSIFEDVDRGLMGEVIDIHDESLLGMDFASLLKSTKLSSFSHEFDENLRATDSRTARKLSFENCYHPDFPQVGIKNSSCIMRSSVEDKRQGRVGVDYVGEGNYENNIESLVADSMNKSIRNLIGELHEDRSTSHYDATPLSKALCSAEVQQGSPWTIEFLNRVREKSRLRMQSLPRSSLAPGSVYPGSAPRAIKIKSPSVLEYYKYQGGCTPRKLMERKRQNRLPQPSTTKDEETSASPLRSWTPVDKRAKRMLSFASSGNSGQTKLVWGSKDSRP
ncbi:hypothetical protein Dimus_000277 [Dionaea muscipula]